MAHFRHRHRGAEYRRSDYMAVGTSPRQSVKRAASGSTDVHFIADLITPVSTLLVLWGVLAGVVLSDVPDRLHWFGPTMRAHRALIGSTVLAGTGLIVVLVAVLLMNRFARRVQRAAEERVALSQRGAYQQAEAAEAAEAALRNGFRQILASLGRRNQSLLHRQLRIIDTLEQQASSPAALAELFTLDHLTTRMRRHAESLTVLSGAAPGRSWSGPVPIIDVMRAAAAEVEDYTRVTVISDAEEAVAAVAVTDMIHLLAELIENATLFSPSSTRVEVRAERVANGFAVEVTDRGLGIPADQLRELNAQLAEPLDVGLADADRLGLFVAGRLAARHGVHVALGPSPYLGTKAVVVLPDSIVVSETVDQGGYGDQPRGDSALLNLRAPQVLSLTDPVQQEPGAGDPGGHDEALAARPAPSALQGLPQRVRPDSQPGNDGAGAAASPEGSPRQPPVEAPTPDDARSLAASLQSSWHRSRGAASPPLPTRGRRTDEGYEDDADNEEA
jgi:signal transduction histidine kinase